MSMPLRKGTVLGKAEGLSRQKDCPNFEAYSASPSWITTASSPVASTPSSTAMQSVSSKDASYKPSTEELERVR